jgi:hypothetical protein
MTAGEMAVMRNTEQEHQAHSALLDLYRRSGLTRGEFCKQTGMSVSTLDYYRRQESKSQQQQKHRQRLVRVKVEAEATIIESRFTLILANGRRIETGARFDEQALARLIRIAEVVE